MNIFFTFGSSQEQIPREDSLMDRSTKKRGLNVKTDKAENIT